MRWDMGVDELIARVVSGIDTVPLGILGASAVLAGAAACGAAVTVFRVTKAATPRTITATRAIFQRVVMTTSSLQRAGQNHIPSGGTQSPQLRGWLELRRVLLICSTLYMGRQSPELS